MMYHAFFFHFFMIFITGVSGFIGYHLALRFLRQGGSVVGIDNLNDYYDVNLKKERLKRLSDFPLFFFYQDDVTHQDALEKIMTVHTDIQHVYHLAAQAGVRYSLKNPYAYGLTNVMGQINLLECCRQRGINHIVYASSSSVYGGNTDLPFKVEDRTDQPLSVYAATKRSCELIAQSYSHLYPELSIIGLRFFTVYGPFGRPDMAAFIFTKAIIESTPLPFFNDGKMKRNFSYIDDVVEGLILCLSMEKKGHRIYNLGNDRTVSLERFVSVLESVIGKKAILDRQALQKGDVPETLADLTRTKEELGFHPQIDIDTGLKNFVQWYKEFYSV